MTTIQDFTTMTASRANMMKETERHTPQATKLTSKFLDPSRDVEKNKEKHIYFAANVKGAAEQECFTQHDESDDEHQAGAADVKDAAEEELFTQHDEFEEKNQAEAVESPSKFCLSLTQCVSNETLYADKSTRGSIRQPYVVVKKEKSAEATFPVHFFEDPEGTSTIKIGGAFRDNSCNVCLSALNAKGYAMNMFGLSNEAMLITYDGGTDKLQLTSTNSGKLVFYQGHTGNSWQINPGKTIDLGDGDELRFADNKNGSPAYPAIRFVHPTWTPDLPPEVKKARDEAVVVIESQVQEEKRCLEEQQRLTREKYNAAVAALEGKRDLVLKCESLEAVAKLMSTLLTGSKRKATEELPTPRTIKSRSTSLKTESERQELQNFRRTHQQAISAKQFLARRPANVGSKWNNQAKKHW